jgi:1,4-dihydroxy-2-naphthoate octaprenyltransferase
MGCCSTLFQIVFFFGLVLFPVVYYVDQQVEQYFIFTPQELQKVAQESIKLHGNNTRALVRDIANKLDK